MSCGHSHVPLHHKNKKEKENQKKRILNQEK